MKKSELRQLIRESLKEVMEADDAPMTIGRAAKEVGQDVKNFGKIVLKLLGRAKVGTEKIIKQIQASPEYKNVEAEIQKELQTGEKSQVIISKLMGILKKAGEIAASTVSTEEKRKALGDLLKVLMYIPAAATVYSLLTNLLNFIPYVDIPTFNAGTALSALIIIIMARVMLNLYKLFGNAKNENLNEEDNLVAADEEEAILKLLQTNQN